MFNVRGPQSPSGNERVNPSPYDFLSSYLSWALAIHRRNSRRMQNTEISYMDNLYLTTLTTSQHSYVYSRNFGKKCCCLEYYRRNIPIFLKKILGNFFPFLFLFFFLRRRERVENTELIRKNKDYEFWDSS